MTYAVESLSGRDAVAIVYASTTTTSPVTKNPAHCSVLPAVHEVLPTRWLVTGLTTILASDLTPQV